MHHAYALTGVAQGQEYRTVRAAKFHGNDAGQIKADGLMPRAVPWKLREHKCRSRTASGCAGTPTIWLHRKMPAAPSQRHGLMGPADVVCFG